jgi:2-dehydro-3-deoxy-D-arabinonate dehydratase
LDIHCRVYRENTLIFHDVANTKQLKRTFSELASYLVRDNVVFDGTVLLTGTSIVPPNEFTLQDGDRIEIEIPEIGILTNNVKNQPQSTF